MLQEEDNYETILQRFKTNKEKLAQYKTGLNSFVKNYEHILLDTKADFNIHSASLKNINNPTNFTQKFKSPIGSPREKRDNNIFDNIDNALTRLKKKYNFEPSIVQTGKRYLKDDISTIDAKIFEQKPVPTNDVVEKIKQR